MFRTFTLPTTSSATSIWDLMIAGGFVDSRGYMLVSTVKNGAIISDRVTSLIIKAATGNSGSVLFRDQFADPGAEQALPTTGLAFSSGRNSICLRDYQVLDSTADDAISVSFESI